MAVSWHADSSLQSGSSIGVLHFVHTRKSEPCDWRIALRPSPSEENGSSGNVPPISVGTADGDAYVRFAWGGVTVFMIFLQLFF